MFFGVKHLFKNGRDAYLQVLGGLVDGLEGVVGARMVALVGMDQQAQPPVALLDVSALRFHFNAQRGIRIRSLCLCALQHPGPAICPSTAYEALSRRLLAGLQWY